MRDEKNEEHGRVEPEDPWAAMLLLEAVRARHLEVNFLLRNILQSIAARKVLLEQIVRNAQGNVCGRW